MAKGSGEGPGKPKDPPAQPQQPAPAPPPSTSVATAPPKGKLTFQGLLDWAKPQLAQILPKHITPERMVALAALAATKTPRLKECTPLSIFDSLVKASRLGLEIGWHAHLVPFRNGKTGTTECVFIPDYRGLIHLAVGSDKVNHIDARPVYGDDDFDYGYGDKPFVKHRPKLDGVRNEANIIAFYAVAHLAAGMSVFDVMSKGEVDSVRGRSRAKDDGPWVTDYEAMGKKTVVKRLCKFLPQNPLLAAAVEADNRAETGEVGTVSAIIDTPDEINQALAKKAQEDAEDLKRKMAQTQPAAAPPAGEAPPAAPAAAAEGSQPGGNLPF